MLPIPAREKLLPMPSAGKNVTGSKRGKKCCRFQARENMLPVPSAGKMLLVSSAGKYVTGAKRGTRCQALEHLKPGPRKNVGHGKGGEILENTSGDIRQIHASDFVFHLFVKQTTAFLDYLASM